MRTEESPYSFYMYVCKGLDNFKMNYLEQMLIARGMFCFNYQCQSVNHALCLGKRKAKNAWRSSWNCISCNCVVVHLGGKRYQLKKKL